MPWTLTCFGWVVSFDGRFCAFFAPQFFVVERCKDWDFKARMLKKRGMDTGVQEMHEYARIL